MAVQTNLRAVERDSTDLGLKNALAFCYYQTKKYEKAIEILSDVLTKAYPQSKEYSDALYYLTYSYDLSGRPDEALEIYKTASEASPEDKNLSFNMGRLYFMQ